MKPETTNETRGEKIVRLIGGIMQLRIDMGRTDLSISFNPIDHLHDLETQLAEAIDAK